MALKKFKFIALLGAVVLGTGLIVFFRAPEKNTAPFVKAPDSGAVFSSYHLPPLAGWDGRVREDDDGEVRSVTYNSRVADTRLQMKFLLYATPRGETAEGLPELRDHMEQAMAKVKESSATAQILEKNEANFRKFPAILTRTKDEKNGGVRERKVLRVADGKNTFMFDQTLSGPNISAAARSEADSAWEKFSSGLNIDK